MTTGFVSTATLVVHVLAGVVALASGAGAILARKGGRRHNKAGKTYVLSMGVVVVTAVPLAVRIESWFLLAIAVFSGYLVFGGYRVVARRQAGLERASRVDRLGNGGMVAVGAVMVAVGGWGSAAGEFALGPVLVAFGCIGGLVALRERRALGRPVEERTPWFERHVVFMGGAFIATVTATVTVNLTTVPPLARWLGPTAVGVPLIFLAIGKYQRRFGQSRSQGP